MVNFVTLGEGKNTLFLLVQALSVQINILPLTLSDICLHLHVSASHFILSTVNDLIFVCSIFHKFGELWHSGIVNGHYDLQIGVLCIHYHSETCVQNLSFSILFKSRSSQILHPWKKLSCFQYLLNKLIFLKMYIWVQQDSFCASLCVKVLSTLCIVNVC